VTEATFCCFVSIMGLRRYYKTSFSTFIFAVFLPNLFYISVLLHKPIYGFVKTNGSDIGILLLVSTFCESNHRRHSYDVIKIFKMAAVDVANQLPVRVW